MLVAMLTSNARPQWVRICTDGRTDGLTQKVADLGADMALSYACEKGKM